MRVLIIGGAGGVGSLVRPAIETAHTVTVFDRVPVDAIGDRSIVGDVGDTDAVRAAVQQTDAIIYMPMGMDPSGMQANFHVDQAFDVNVRDFFRCLTLGLEAGVNHYIYTSSLSVYRRLWKAGHVDEDRPPNAWDPYGMSKRLAERLCEAASRYAPQATILALRLSMPVTLERREQLRKISRVPECAYTLPHDARAIFLAALAFSQPGVQVVQATGDVNGHVFPNARAEKLFGYRPVGR